MGGHWHDSRAGTQNQGNHIGDRSCVRQSKLYRRYESGNQVKDLLGQGGLKWDENKKQGAYSGKVYDHNKANHDSAARPPPKYGRRAQQDVHQPQGADGAQPAAQSYAMEYQIEDRANQMLPAAAVRAMQQPMNGFFQPQSNMHHAQAVHNHGGQQHDQYEHNERMANYAAMPNAAQENAGPGAGMRRAHNGQHWAPQGQHYTEAQAPMQGMKEGRQGAPRQHNGEIAVEVVISGQNDHEFGKTTAPSVLKTRPW